jgi:formate dehydrogenase major subunit
VSAGATLIHVDPRFTRTSAMADIHVPDPAGHRHRLARRLIRHVLEKEAYFKEYVVAFTNAPVIVREDFPRHRGSGRALQRLEREDGEYHVDSWQYEGAGTIPAAGHKHLPADSTAGADAPEKRPATLQERGRDTAAPALRVPDPQAALLPVHPGDRRADLRRAAPSSRRWPRR